jgi:hypothetical protein
LRESEFISSEEILIMQGKREWQLKNINR